MDVILCDFDHDKDGNLAIFELIKSDKGTNNGKKLGCEHIYVCVCGVDPC